MPKSRNSRSKSPQSAADITGRDPIFQNVQEIFRDRVDADVIYMVLSECNWIGDDAVDKLLHIAENADIQRQYKQKSQLQKIAEGVLGPLSSNDAANNVNSPSSLSQADKVIQRPVKAASADRASDADSVPPGFNVFSSNQIHVPLGGLTARGSGSSLDANKLESFSDDIDSDLHFPKLPSRKPALSRSSASSPISTGRTYSGRVQTGSQPDLMTEAQTAYQQQYDDAAGAQRWENCKNLLSEKYIQSISDMRRSSEDLIATRNDKTPQIAKSKSAEDNYNYSAMSQTFHDDTGMMKTSTDRTKTEGSRSFPVRLLSKSPDDDEEEVEVGEAVRANSADLDETVLKCIYEVHDELIDHSVFADNLERQRSASTVLSDLDSDKQSGGTPEGSGHGTPIPNKQPMTLPVIGLSVDAAEFVPRPKESSKPDKSVTTKTNVSVKEPIKSVRSNSIEIKSGAKNMRITSPTVQLTPVSPPCISPGHSPIISPPSPNVGSPVSNLSGSPMFITPKWQPIFPRMQSTPPPPLRPPVSVIAASGTRYMGPPPPHHLPPPQYRLPAGTQLPPGQLPAGPLPFSSRMVYPVAASPPVFHVAGMSPHMQSLSPHQIATSMEERALIATGQPIMATAEQGRQLSKAAAAVPLKLVNKSTIDNQVQKIRELQHNGKKVLIIMRGLPGSGKTTLSRAIKMDGVVLSTDDYFTKGDMYSYNPDKLAESHQWNRERAKEAMKLGTTPIVIDNTNTQKWEFKPYVSMAHNNGYHVEIMEPDTPWKNSPKELARMTMHGVPKDQIQRMLQRYEKNITVEMLITKKKSNMARRDSPVNANSFEEETNVGKGSKKGPAHKAKTETGTRSSSLDKELDSTNSLHVSKKDEPPRCVTPLNGERLPLGQKRLGLQSLNSKSKSKGKQVSSKTTVTKEVTKESAPKPNANMSEETVKVVDDLVSEHVIDKSLSKDDLVRLEKELKALLQIYPMEDKERDAAEALISEKLHGSPSEAATVEASADIRRELQKSLHVDVRQKSSGSKKAGGKPSMKNIKSDPSHFTSTKDIYNHLYTSDFQQEIFEDTYMDPFVQEIDATDISPQPMSIESTVADSGDVKLDDSGKIGDVKLDDSGKVGDNKLDDSGKIGDVNLDDTYVKLDDSGKIGDVNLDDTYVKLDDSGKIGDVKLDSSDVKLDDSGKTGDVKLDNSGIINVFTDANKHDPSGSCLLASVKTFQNTSEMISETQSNPEPVSVTAVELQYWNKETHTDRGSTAAVESVPSVWDEDQPDQQLDWSGEVVGKVEEGVRPQRQKKIRHNSNNTSKQQQEQKAKGANKENCVNNEKDSVNNEKDRKKKKEKQSGVDSKSSCENNSVKKAQVSEKSKSNTDISKPKVNSLEAVQDKKEKSNDKNGVKDYSSEGPAVNEAQKKDKMKLQQSDSNNKTQVLNTASSVTQTKDKENPNVTKESHVDREDGGILVCDNDSFSLLKTSYTDIDASQVTQNITQDTPVEVSVGEINSSTSNDNVHLSIPTDKEEKSSLITTSTITDSTDSPRDGHEEVKTEGSDQPQDSPRRKKQNRKKLAAKFQGPFFNDSDKHNFSTGDWASYPVTSEHLNSSTDTSATTPLHKDTLKLTDQETVTLDEDFRVLNALNQGGFVDSSVVYIKCKHRTLVETADEPVRGDSEERRNEKHSVHQSTSTDDLIVEQSESITFLKTCFPNTKAQELEDVLDNCDGNVEWAVDLMLDWKYSSDLSDEEQRQFVESLDKFTKAYNAVSAQDGAVENKHPENLRDLCFNLIEEKKIATKEELEQQLIQTGKERLNRIEGDNLTKIRLRRTSSMSETSPRSQRSDLDQSGMSVFRSLSLPLGPMSKVPENDDVDSVLFPTEVVRNKIHLESNATNESPDAALLNNLDTSETNIRKLLNKISNHSDSSSGHEHNNEVIDPLDSVEVGRLVPAVTMQMGPDLVHQLERLFGPIDAADKGGGSVDVELDHRTAFSLYQCLKHSLADTRQLLRRQLAQDEELARRLQEEEDNRSQGQGSTAAPGPKPLVEIMAEEAQLQTKQQQFQKLLAYEGSQNVLATRMKRNKLYTRFPNLDRTMLDEVFQNQFFNLTETVRTIEAHLGMGDVSGGLALDGSQLEEKLTEDMKLQSVHDTLDSFLYTPHASKDYQDGAEPEYEDYRGEAHMHQRLRHECFQKAQEAFRRGLKQVASFYSQQGHLHTQKIKEANMRASELILEDRNSDLEKNLTLDLHGLHVDEAISAMDRILPQKQREQKKGYLTIITGRGSHSRGGVAKLRPSVLMYLKKNQYNYSEVQTGFIKVSLKYRRFE